MPHNDALGPNKKMRFTFFCFLFVAIVRFAVYARQNTATSAGNSNFTLNNTLPRDSAALANENRQQFVEDSIAMFYIIPDPLRGNLFISRIWKNNLFNVDALSPVVKQPGVMERSGHIRNSRQPWIIAVIIGLFIYTGLLNLFLSRDIQNVIQSFYNKQALSQVEREGSLVNPWAFVGLFLLFCLTASLVLYLFTMYKNVGNGIGGFQLFISISVIISLLFALKFIVLKFIGFIFDVNGLVSEYIAILNLTYFNVAFVLLPVALCFSLLATRFVSWLLIFALASIAVMFAWQYLRNSIKMISNFRFHKLYLFIYLCALEICPILILIKVLHI